MFLIRHNFKQLTRQFSSNLFENVPVFKSNYSLDKIYPKSTLDIASKKEQPKSVDEFSGHIPIDKLEITYCRSSGPGGQHVNKTNTKVTVKFHLASADWIPEKIREKLAVLHKNSINKDGFWQVRSDKTREQHINLADCMDKLRCFITEASQPAYQPAYQPSQETLEIIRIRREKAAQERLKNKRMRSSLKRDRQLTE